MLGGVVLLSRLFLKVIFIEYFVVYLVSVSSVS